MPVTIKDVAKLAGVSPTTVSRAMNKRGYISADAQNKIRQAMEELNYSPNLLARSLFHSKTRMIGYVVPSISYPFFAEMAQLIEERLYEHNYHMLLCTTNGSSDRESDIFDMLRQHRVEAIIIGSHTLADKVYSKSDVPILAFDTLLKTAQTTVAANHKLGGRMAAQRLLQGGCRHALQIIGNPQASTGAQERHQSFFQVMTEAGISCISVPVDKKSDLQTSMYHELVEMIFKTYPQVDAYFATDLYALEILRYGQKQGWTIPERFQVIGYDGTSITNASYPRLTTIRQPYELLAENIVNAICMLLDGKPVKKEITLDDLVLIEGETVRPTE